MPKIKETLEDLNDIEQFFGELQRAATDALEKLRELRNDGYRWSRLAHAHQMSRARGTVVGLKNAILEESRLPVEHIEEIREELIKKLGTNFGGSPELFQRLCRHINLCTFNQLTSLLVDLDTHIAFREEEEELSFDDLIVNGQIKEFLDRIPQDVTIKPAPAELRLGLSATVRVTRNEDRRRRSDQDLYGYPRSQEPENPGPGKHIHKPVPISFRPDLAYHAKNWVITSPEDNVRVPALPLTVKKFLAISEMEKPMWMANRLAFFPRSSTSVWTDPVIVDELHDITSETRKALHDAERRDGVPSHPLLCIWDLITWDREQPVRLMDYKRIGESRVLEIQTALGQLGFIRDGIDVFIPKYENDEVVEVDKDQPALGGSIIKCLFRRFRRQEWLLDLFRNENARIKDIIMPNWEIRNHEIRHKGRWLRLFPDLAKAGVGGTMTDNFRGLVHKRIPTVSALHSLTFKDFLEIGEELKTQMAEGTYPVKYYFPGVLDLDERVMSAEPPVGFLNILAAYATIKAVFGRNERDENWYEWEYGHRYWWWRKDPEEFALPLTHP